MDSMTWSNEKMRVLDLDATTEMHWHRIMFIRQPLNPTAAKCNEYKNIVNDSYIFLQYSCKTRYAEAVKLVALLEKWSTWRMEIQISPSTTHSNCNTKMRRLQQILVALSNIIDLLVQNFFII